MQAPSTTVAPTAVLPSNPPAQRVRREIWPLHNHVWTGTYRRMGMACLGMD
jgi:hypothetical protein